MNFGKFITTVFSAAAFLTAAPESFAAEKTIKLGGDKGWNAIQLKNGVSAIKGLRPYPVLILSSGIRGAAVENDLYLSFDGRGGNGFTDQCGNYTVEAGVNVQIVDEKSSFKGQGAALFYDISEKDNEIIKITPKNSALLSGGNGISDFTIEFDMLPSSIYAGAEIFLWQAESPLQNGAMPEGTIQSIRCSLEKNRVCWQFTAFFVSADEKRAKDIKIAARSPVVPKVWSNHLIRFDSGTGMLEYLVNGKSDAIVYATDSGREDGNVWAPVAGKRGCLYLGADFAGMIDEFRITDTFGAGANTDLYAAEAGRFESTAFDLGSSESSFKKISALGGNFRKDIEFQNGKNTYKRDGTLSFEDNSQVQFFVRGANSIYKIEDAEWQPVRNNEEVFAMKGRYLQVAADFYTGERLNSAPYIEEIKVIYSREDPPLPPANFTARPLDGAVQLSWKERSDNKTKGYLVYYGTKPGEYFGSGSFLGASPVDVGKVSSVRLDNLQNGVLYYFAVCAYDAAGIQGAGDFSREVSARPLRMIE